MSRTYGIRHVRVGVFSNSFCTQKAFRTLTNNSREINFMSRVSARTKEAVSSKEILQDPMQSSTTVIEHVLSRLKDIGISKVFGVAGDFAFPIEDVIVGFPGLDWVGCCNELNASY